MFDLDTCIAFITNNTAKKVSYAFNERLVKLGVTRVQWIALYYLGVYEEISQLELGQKMDIKASTVARLIDRMERDGYAERVKSDEDRRITNLKITEKGRKLREDLLPEGEKISKLISKNISDEEIEVFKNVLNKMADNISEEAN